MNRDREVEQGRDELQGVRELSQQRANRSVKTINLRTISIERYIIAILGLAVISLSIQVCDLRESMKANHALTTVAEKNVQPNHKCLSVLKDILSEIKDHNI
jgi:hypothetical protein